MVPKLPFGKALQIPFTKVLELLFGQVLAFPFLNVPENTVRYCSGAFILEVPDEVPHKVLESLWKHMFCM